jgi:hypothetical protein
MHLSELLVQGMQVRKIKPPVQGSDSGNPLAPGDGKVQMVDVEVHDIEVSSLAGEHFDHPEMKCERVAALSALQAQRSLDRRPELGAGDRIAARKESHVVAAPNAFLRQVGNDPFGSSVEFRRHALLKWGNLRNSHDLLSLASCLPTRPSPFRIRGRVWQRSLLRAAIFQSFQKGLRPSLPLIRL